LVGKNPEGRDHSNTYHRTDSAVTMSKNNLNIVIYSIHVKIRGRKAPEVRHLVIGFLIKKRQLGILRLGLACDVST